MVFFGGIFHLRVAITQHIADSHSSGLQGHTTAAYAAELESHLEKDGGQDNLTPSSWVHCLHDQGTETQYFVDKPTFAN